MARPSTLSKLILLRSKVYWFYRFNSIANVMLSVYYLLPQKKSCAYINMIGVRNQIPKDCLNDWYEKLNPKRLSEIV